MKTHHPENVRIVRKYLCYLKEASGYAEPSLDQVAKAIRRFEEHTQFRDFKLYRPEQAKAFKAKLYEQTGLRSGQRLSVATICSTLRHLKAFFRWLASQPGYKSRMTYSDADYFSPPENDLRIARTRRERAGPTLDQVAHVLATMSSGSDIELRDRALVAFLLLTCARDGAVASLKLKHVDLAEWLLFQDGREVNTKRGKTISTWFFPVGQEPLRIVSEWIEHLRRELLWGDDDPLFPATKMGHRKEDHGFMPVGLERSAWTDADPIRRIVREAFVKAGLPAFNPHGFRKTVAQLGLRVCRTPEEFKAWSQNMGHDEVTTTLTCYSQLSTNRQAEVIRELHKRIDHAGDQAGPDAILEQIARLVKGAA